MLRKICRLLEIFLNKITIIEEIVKKKIRNLGESYQKTF